MEKLRIGFFTDSYFPEIDGVTYTLKSWKERLEKRGHEVYIIYPNSSEYKAGENEIAVPSLPNPFYDGYRIPFPTTMDRLPKLDIVHCHTPFTLGRLGKFYAQGKNLPTVYTHHTKIEEFVELAVPSKILANTISKIYLPLENRFLQGFDTVTSSSDCDNREVEILELPVGVDLEFFQETESSFIDEMNLERPIAGYSGRISVEKNIGEMLDFAEEFEGSLIIIGEGPLKPEMVERAPENVYFKDFLPREKLPEFYTGIDVFVTSSTGDTLGLSTLEANACGTPVVAPDVMPFKETIQRENGERYPSGDVEELKKSCGKVLDREFETREAVKKYSLERAVDQIEEVYSGLTGEDIGPEHRDV